MKYNCYGHKPAWVREGQILCTYCFVNWIDTELDQFQASTSGVRNVSISSRQVHGTKLIVLSKDSSGTSSRSSRRAHGAELVRFNSWFKTIMHFEAATSWHQTRQFSSRRAHGTKLVRLVRDSIQKIIHFEPASSWHYWPLSITGLDILVLMSGGYQKTNYSKSTTPCVV